jgi:hypothetical protein
LSVSYLLRLEAKRFGIYDTLPNYLSYSLGVSPEADGAVRRGGLY